MEPNELSNNFRLQGLAIPNEAEETGSADLGLPVELSFEALSKICDVLAQLDSSGQGLIPIRDSVALNIFEDKTIGKFPKKSSETIEELTKWNRLTMDFTLSDLWGFELHQIFRSIEKDLAPRSTAKPLLTSCQAIRASVHNLISMSLRMLSSDMKRNFKEYGEKSGWEEDCERNLYRYYYSEELVIPLAKNILTSIDEARLIPIISGENLSPEQLKVLSSGGKTKKINNQVQSALNKVSRLIGLFVDVWTLGEQDYFYKNMVKQTKHAFDLDGYDIKEHLKVLLDYFDFKHSCLVKELDSNRKVIDIDFSAMTSGAENLRKELEKQRIDMNAFFRFQNVLEKSLAQQFIQVGFIQKTNRDYFGKMIDRAVWYSRMRLEPSLESKKRSDAHFMAQILYFEKVAENSVQFNEELLFKVSEINTVLYPGRYKSGTWELEQIFRLFKNLYAGVFTLRKLSALEDSAEVRLTKKEARRIEEEKKLFVPRGVLDGAMLRGLQYRLGNFKSDMLDNVNFASLNRGFISYLVGIRARLLIGNELRVFYDTVKRERKLVLDELREYKNLLGAQAKVTVAHKLLIKRKWTELIQSIPIEWFDLMYGHSLLIKVQRDTLDPKLTGSEQNLDRLEISESLFQVLGPLNEIDEIFPDQPVAKAKAKGAGKKGPSKKDTKKAQLNKVKQQLQKRAASAEQGAEEEEGDESWIFERGEKTRSIQGFLESHGFDLEGMRGDHAKYVNEETGNTVIVPVARDTQKVGTLRSIEKQMGKIPQLPKE